MLVALALAPASACQTYPTRTRLALRDFQRGHLEEARAAFADPDVTGSEFLSGAEAGTVALVAGDWDGALDHFGSAAAESREFEDRTLLSPDRTAEELASWVFNDTSRKYLGEGFERVYLHAGMAMAYFAKGELDGVWVENRLANELLEHEEELYEKQYAAGGLGHFLSALSYELLGELDQAYLDYERMEAKGIGLELVGPALARIADAKGFDDELPLWLEKYGTPAELPEGAASIVLIAGVGLGPFKSESSLTVPTDDGLFRVAVPEYRPRPQAVSGLRIVLADSGASVRSAVIEDVGRVTRENLEDRLAWSAARSAVRAIAKRNLTKNLEKDHGLGGRILGDVFTLLSERADLRCWTTLPDSWQAARVFVPPGVHALALEAVEGGREELGRFELEPGETMILLARSIGRELYVHPVGGRRIGAAPAIDDAADLPTALPPQP